MKSIFSSVYTRFIFLGISLIMIIASMAYMSHLALLMKEEETKKIELWAEATRQFIQADEFTNIDFISTVIEGNTTIPVYMLDSDGNVLLMRNVTKPVEDPTQLNGPIEVRISSDIVQYIYYDQSTTLLQLRIFPYIELGIVVLFVAMAIYTLYVSQRSIQNQVWVGLSKETAHQLGTPISSLIAWQELLRNRYPTDELIPQMQMDIDRLQTITERFSKIGSVPALTVQRIVPLVEEVVDYMRVRTSDKVHFDCSKLSPRMLESEVCAPLFKWVVENLIKNAVDAMNGVGEITLTMGYGAGKIWLDITDTGKGIGRKDFSTVFNPGFTSKKRGWGLGLSLSKRIIEDYHRGKIFVKQSQIGVGTTFRIVLKESINS